MSKRKTTSARTSKRTEPTLAEISLAPIPLSTLLQPIYLIAVCAVMMLFGALALRLMVDIDIGFHLHGGEWIWQHRAFPDKDAYTYTVPNNDYIDMHWLYQLLLFGIYSLSGFEGLTLFNALLILTALGLLLVRLLSIGTPIPLALAMLVWVGLIMEIRFSVRPEVLTWSFLLLTILTLERYLRSVKKILQYIKETRGELAESFFNLASLYYRAKEPSLARYCYEKYVRMGGNHPLAQKRLLELSAK